MNVPELFAGENRRAAVMGAVGVPVIVALLLFRLVSGGESATVAAPAVPAVRTAVVPPVTASTVPVPRPSFPVDPALLRDPFCPLVASAAAPGAPPTVCAPRSVPPGRQSVTLDDIFGEQGILLARMRVGQFTYANLHEGDAVSGGLRVVSLAERCGEFEMAGTPFALCIGEQTSK
jgi:hypothetical protein